MATSQELQHHTLSLSYSARAALPATSPLVSYLLQLMTIKRTNLCLSADVTTTSELLSIADELGDYICLLKTHADIVSDWSDHTVRQLKDIANRKKFLIFEDRKFADIGSTVQKQYIAGPLSIAKFAEVVTVHVISGPSVVTALKQAAATAITDYNTKVHTEISSGPSQENYVENGTAPELQSTRPFTLRQDSDGTSPANSEYHGVVDKNNNNLRKPSIVSISTTISTRSEPMSPQPNKTKFTSAAGQSDGPASTQDALIELGPIPYLRSALLLAQMSSAGNLLTPEYTQKCVDIGRDNRDFVMGFISQKSLNTTQDDNFLTLTPGVKLVDGGDGLGQQYRTPRTVIQQDGADIIIVGRGILEADDRYAVAQQYRSEAWNAYEARVRARS